MRVTLGVGVTRSGVDELITGLWSFANALGLLTDVIGERTAAAGVTVDGLLIKDAGIPEAAVTAHESALAILESQIADGTILARLAAAETVVGAWDFNAAIDFKDVVAIRDLALATSSALRLIVTGDSFHRLFITAAGRMSWGSGAVDVDTNLYRNAADELKTDDAFTVGSALNVLEELNIRINLITLTTDVENVSTDAKTAQRLTGDANWAIGGWVAGANGRLIFVFNADTSNTFALKHESVSSAAANRMILPGATAMSLGVREGVWLMYDGTSSRWTAIKHEI